MTCHGKFDRLLQVTCMGLLGILAVAGCSGSGGSAPDAKAKDGGAVSGPEVPPAPVLRVSTAVLAFGDVDINPTSPPALSVTVTNTGSLVALSPAVTGTGFTMASTTCGTAAASCTISVQFAPTTAGSVSGTLTVAAGLTVSLSGTGRTPGTFTATSGGVPATVPTNQNVPVSVTIATTGAVTGLTCLSSGPELAADPVAANTTCTGAVAANASCVYGFVFKATTAGAKNDSIVCNSAGNSRTVLVNTTAVAPASPASLALSNPGPFSVAVGSTSPVITFNLANSGGTMSGALTTTLAGTGAAEFTITDNKCLVPLVPLGICEIQVVFHPTSAGAKTATITVTDATVGSTPATTTLTGTAVSAPTAVVTGAATLGDVVVGRSGTASTFTITNSGGTTTGALSLSASNPEFAIPAATDSCTGKTLAAAATCTFAVTFSPTSAGAKSAVLSVSSGGTIVGTLQIAGNGTPPPTPAVLGMTPLTLDFGTIGVATVSPTQTFTVTNNGGTATGALAVTNTGVGGASQFTSTTTCQALAPAASCQVVVTFKPTIAGSASATFTVGDGTVVSPARTAVGTALDRPGLGIACAPSSFADTVVGLTSAAVVCTVSNSANSVQATGILTATPTGDFAIPTNNCTVSLNPGLSCTMSVVFKPTAAGARTGTITVTGTNGGAVNQNLTGTGLGVIDIQEFTGTGTTPTLVEAGNYDFGSVSAGSTSTTTVVLAVYIRAAVGNLTVAKAFGTPADFAQVAGAVNFTWPGTASATSVPACLALTTTAPTPNATVPYCTVQVSFTPQSKGAKTGTVTATGAIGAATGTATVKGTAAGPISINPSQVTFAAVAQGTAGPSATLTVCNNAATQATGAQFTITGTNAADFAVTLDKVSNATIAAHACVDLALSLDIPAAETATALSATVTVSATVGGVVESDTAALVGAAAGGPALQASLGSGVFADTPITATTGPVTVTVSNAGGLSSGALTFDLPTGSEFSLTGTLTSTGPDRGTCASTCSSDVSCTAGALATGASCTLKVWFLPTPALGVGGRTDTLRVGSASGAIAVLPLSANALSQLAATPATVALGPSGVAGVGAPMQTVTIKNVGAANATTMTVAFKDFGTQTGNADSVFAFLPAAPECVAGLIAGETCAIGVKMVTSLEGTFATTIVVTNNVNGQSAEVLVTGTSGEAILQFTQATDMDRDLGTVPRGDTSAAVTYTVTNVGNVTSGPISFNVYDQVAGPAPDTNAHTPSTDFPFTGSTCNPLGTTTLDPGASCNINVAFNPRTATLTSLIEYLQVTATPGTPAAGILRLVRARTAAAGVVAFIGDSPLTKRDVYDFGAATTAQIVTLALYNPDPNNPLPVPAAAPTVAFANVTPALAGAVAGAGEFAILAGTGATSTCQFVGGAVTSLAAGSVANPTSCTFRVRWTPVVATAGTRAVTFGVGGLSMDLYGRVPGPGILVAKPTHLDFGHVSQNSVTATLTLTVTNIGESSLNVGRPNPTVAGVSYGTGCNNVALAAGDSCYLAVSVNPANATAAAATVTVQSPATGTAVDFVTVPVTWTPTNTNAAVINPLPTSSAAAPLDFGNIPVLATSAATPITMRNNATNALPTGSLSFAVKNTDGSPNYDFAVDASGVGSCADITYADGLNSGQVCTVTVAFTPRTLTTPDKTGTLVVTSTSGAQATVYFAGTAVAALTVSSAAQAAAGEDPLGTAGGVTFTAAAGTTPASCAYGTRAVTTAT
ncbi:MAG TPA: choice-of-anchor D domain-containing protein, partial [Polyangia bacterium]|nr:choice-of-anchor D domain-containing protein [Polyangia bacterium]